MEGDDAAFPHVRPCCRCLNLHHYCCFYSFAAPPPRAAQRPEAPEDAKLYCSNLPPSMTNDLLRSVFAPFGEVYDARAIGANQGQCRGFGFVTMATSEAAAAAIKCAPPAPPLCHPVTRCPPLSRQSLGMQLSDRRSLALP